MTNTPSYPLIIIDSSGFDIVHNESHLTKCRALALVQGFYKTIRGYSRDGFVWQVSSIDSEYKINTFTKFLANTIYNPSITAVLHWEKGKKYQLSDLKKSLKNLVDKDDDIITQFEEGHIIKKSIDTCASFEELIQILNKYVFEVDEETLWKEQEARE